jgi:hypothetical protein
MIQALFTRLVRGLLTAFRVPEEKILLYRDIGLGLPVALGLLIANAPLALWMGGQQSSAHLLHLATLLFVGSTLLSCLSPNWGTVLTAAWSVVALRWLVAAVETGSILPVLAAFASGAIALAWQWIKPDIGDYK